jgi:hypothetical protein
VRVKASGGASQYLRTGAGFRRLQPGDTLRVATHGGDAAPDLGRPSAELMRQLPSLGHATTSIAGQREVVATGTPMRRLAPCFVQRVRIRAAFGGRIQMLRQASRCAQIRRTTKLIKTTPRKNQEENKPLAGCFIHTALQPLTRCRVQRLDTCTSLHSGNEHVTSRGALAFERCHIPNSKVGGLGGTRKHSRHQRLQQVLAFELAGEVSTIVSD